jgi:hypothetical protein
MEIIIAHVRYQIQAKGGSCLSLRRRLAATVDLVLKLNTFASDVLSNLYFQPTDVLRPSWRRVSAAELADTCSTHNANIVYDDSQMCLLFSTRQLHSSTSLRDQQPLAVSSTGLRLFGNNKSNTRSSAFPLLVISDIFMPSSPDIF